MQAWGGPVIGDNRPTLAFPTRSGVLGVIACCMGIPRSDTARLVELAEGARVHIRVDAAGTPLVDDQTIQGNPNASTTRQTIRSKRTYLCDASFVAVVVPGPHVSCRQIAQALRAPVFAPYLGRRCCVPSVPLLAKEGVEGDDPIALFAGIERGPTDLLEQLARGADRRRDGAEQDFFLDAAEYPGALRRFTVRDHLTGPLPRQWRERAAVHVRRASC